MHLFSFGDPSKLKTMDPFLADNPKLETLSISRCSLESADIHLLSDQLMRRSADTLRAFDFSSNQIGDINLDTLIMALIKNGGYYG